MKFFFLSLFIFLFAINSSQANRKKLGPTHDKVTGSIVDLVHKKNKIEKKYNRLKQEQSSRQKGVLILNQTDQDYHFAKGSRAEKKSVKAYSSLAWQAESEAPLTTGSSFALKSSSPWNEYTLQAGAPIPIPQSDHYLHVDSLENLEHWLILISPQAVWSQPSP